MNGAQTAYSRVFDVDVDLDLDLDPTLDVDGNVDV